MTIFITALVVLLVSVLGAYTSVFQETTLRLGRKLASSNSFLSTGLQDAITPRTQTFRSVLFFILLLALLICSFITFNWYLAILIVLFSFFIVTPFVKNFFPKAGSPFYIMKIKTNLLNRLKKYEAKNDTVRALAVKYVLMRLGLECWEREITTPREWQIDNWTSFNRERKIMFVNELRKTTFKKDLSIFTTLNRPSDFYVDEVDSLIAEAKSRNFELKASKKWGLAAMIICIELAKELSNFNGAEYELLLSSLKSKLGDVNECFEEIMKIRG